jgi:purine-nucleoside phosphorylase
MAFDPSWHPEGAQCELALRERLAGLGGNFQAGVDWMIVGGSGIGRPLVEAGEHTLGLVIRHEIPLTEIGLPAPSVAGHGNSLVFGELPNGDGPAVRVCVQTGRIHPYEGHSVGIATAPLGAVLGLGCRSLLLTCAVGGIDPKLRTGEIVSLRDQIGLFGPTPLRGAAFVDCSDLYSAKLRARLRTLSSELAEVIYAHARGPQYETPAEVAALRLLGGQVVGMSTTYEAILAAAHATPTCGLGVVTNAAGSEALSHLEVQVESGRARGRLSDLIRSLLHAE